MKNPDELVTEEGYVLKPRKRESGEITLKIPKDVLASLDKIAKKRDLPVHALLKLYIGQGLRQDLSQEEAKKLALKRLKSRRDSKETAETDLAA